MDHHPGHDRVVLNAYERHQWELMERHLADEAPGPPDVVARNEKAAPDAVWFGVLFPCSWLVAGVWLLLLGSLLGILFVAAALVSATVTAVVRGRKNTSHVRKDR